MQDVLLLFQEERLQIFNQVQHLEVFKIKCFDWLFHLRPFFTSTFANIKHLTVHARSSRRHTLGWVNSFAREMPFLEELTCYADIPMEGEEQHDWDWWKLYQQIPQSEQRPHYAGEL